MEPSGRPGGAAAALAAASPACATARPGKRPAPAHVAGDPRRRGDGGILDSGKWNAARPCPCPDTASLLEELSEQIAWDGQQAEPRLRTGAAFDDLRRAARELRCRGVSLGARQPAVRDAIKTFLDQQVGTDGGPVDAAQRAKWVAAFKAVAQAAAETAR